MPVLLAIVAHPDDESYGIGGTLAKYAHKGWDVHVAIATDGSAGTPVKDYERLDIVDTRAKETNIACAILGTNLHWFGFVDSGMQGDANHAFCKQPPNLVQQKIKALLHDLKPDVVITHDKMGGYFHPDHIYCSQIVTQVCKELQVPLYHMVIPKWWIILHCVVLRLKDKDPTKQGRNKDRDHTKIGVTANKRHVTIDARAYFEIKKKACAAHASQGGIYSSYFTSVPKCLQNQILGKEYFERIIPQNTNKSTRF